MALSKHILSLFLVMILANKLAHSQPDVTSFRIDSFNPSTDGLKYERDAFVPSGWRSLRLIATDGSGTPKTSSVGRVLYPNPIKFWDQWRQASFETTIKFAVSPVDNDPVDGLTFFIVPVNSTTPTGGQGGNLGIFNAVTSGSRIFAVEFDVFPNPVFDPNYRHIGIDINSQKSANTTSFEKAMGHIVSARISYHARSRRITVYATYGLQTSTVSYTYNLKSLLPRQVQVGISASTGPTRYANFDVFSWSFASTMVVDTILTNDNHTYIQKYVQ